MGGGDLNLKKSWHPSTYHNLEKVWKAEQRHDAEKKKIEQLQKEIQEERAREDMHRMAVDSGVIKKKDERVDWLYSGPAAAINREEYLLGKKIDKLVDPVLQEQEQEKQALASGPGALFVAPDGANTTSDLAVKVREDPLFVIRKKEEDAKKLLMSNPIKMKQLQQLLEKKSKHKKSRGKRKHSSGSEEERPSAQRTKLSDDRERVPSSRHRGSREKDHKRESHDRSHDAERGHRSHDAEKGHRSHDAERDQRSHDAEKGHRSHDAERGHRSHDAEKGRKLHEKSHDLGKNHKVLPDTRRYHRTSRPKLSQEELEKKRMEMMEDAKVHGKLREGRLRQYEHTRHAEEDDAKKEHSLTFVESLKVQSLTSSHSLEDRIHRNISSVQRTSAALASDFLT
ncbi:hypothetical protein EMCRGX_G021383 [Ephydatia muelleri]|eukprot:Em0009g53a